MPAHTTLADSPPTTTHAPTYPAHWRMARLGDVARVLYGKARPHDDGNVPVIGSGGVFGMTSQALTAHETLVIGRKGAAGAVFYNSTPCYPSDTAFYLDWIDELCAPFVYFHLLHHSLAPDRSVIPSLARADVENYRLMLPPLAEQRAIARILRAAQDAIAARRREVTLERERKTALMQRLFTHGTHGEPTKQTEIGEMPQSWQVVRLGEVASITSGGTPDRSVPEYWDGDIPWVKTGEIDYKIIQQTEEHITEAGLANSSAKWVNAGTLLMAMYGQGITRGKVAILGIRATLNQACAAIHLTSAALVDYVFYVLAFSYNTIRNLGHGANQKNLNSLLIKSIQIPLPPLAEQRAIADTLAACDTHIAALEREIALHEELFRALLEELMSGRLSALLVEENASGKA